MNLATPVSLFLCSFQGFGLPSPILPTLASTVGLSPSHDPLSPAAASPSVPAASSASSLHSLTVGDALHHARKRVKAVERRQKKAAEESRKAARELKQSLQDQNVKITNLEIVVGTQRALINSQAEALKASEAKIAELTRRVSESEEKILVFQQGSRKRPAPAPAPPAPPPPAQEEKGELEGEPEERGGRNAPTKRKRARL